MRILGFEFGGRAAPAAAAPARQPRALGAYLPLDSATNSAELLNMLRGSGALTMGNPDTALKIAAVYRCTTLISGAVATMPLAVKRRVNGVRLDASDHPLWPILNRRPNPWQTPSQFRRQLQMHLLLRGEAYAMKIRTGDRIAGLIPLMPGRVEVTQLDNWQLQFAYTTRKGARIVLPQRDVLHLVGHTLDGVRGLSPIGCARETVGLALSMQRHANRTFANGARISGVLSHPDELGAEARERLREGLEEFREGGANEDRDLILEEGMKYERIGLSMADAQFVEQGTANRAEIFMIYGVPPHMAGETTKSTSWGSGIEQQSLGFVAYTLEDWLTTWEESIARDLIAETDRDTFVRFNRAALIRGDIKTRSSAYAIDRQWSLKTIDEIRALEDLPPLPNGEGAQPHVGGNGQRTDVPEDPKDPAHAD